MLKNQSLLLEWDTLLQFLVDIVQAMVYLHSCESPVLHGDLKTSRFLVDENWRVKVVPCVVMAMFNADKISHSLSGVS